MVIHLFISDLSYARRAKMSSLENSIPMTTTLMNRMNKRKDAAVPKYYIKHQRLSDPDHNNPARKVKIDHFLHKWIGGILILSYPWY